MKKILLLTIALLSLSSCGLYKKYEREQMWFVDSLYRRMEISGDSLSTATVAWDHMFTDPILQEWIQLGLDYNTDLNVARHKVKEAEAALLSARWALLPGATFSAQGGAPGNFSARADASWQADIFGSLRNTKRKAQAAVEQSKAYEQAVQTQLVATIANSYYTLVTLDEKLAISKRTIEDQQTNPRHLGREHPYSRSSEARRKDQ